VTAPKSRLFYRIRLALLGSVLAVTVLYALNDTWSRRERNAWKRPLEVAIVVAELEPVGETAMRNLTMRVPVLEERLTSELHRYRSTPERAVHLSVFGPVGVDRAPPADPKGSELLELARHTYDLWRWTHAVDQGADLSARAYDSRIYLVVRPPRNAGQKWVEGSSEQGGRVGVARVELDASMSDFALFVVSHELFHTLGASDKYGPDGRVLIPSGLAEPDRAPRFPQRAAEIMARNLPLSPDSERPPDSLAELMVGPSTAREIGWTAGP
jgi:hypothetical protein